MDTVTMDTVTMETVTMDTVYLTLRQWVGMKEKD